MAPSAAMNGRARRPSRKTAEKSAKKVNKINSNAVWYGFGIQERAGLAAGRGAPGDCARWNGAPHPREAPYSRSIDETAAAFMPEAVLSRWRRVPRAWPKGRGAFARGDSGT